MIYRDAKAGIVSVSLDGQDVQQLNDDWEAFSITVDNIAGNLCTSLLSHHLFLYLYFISFISLIYRTNLVNFVIRKLVSLLGLRLK